jgi:hypothetical protein
MSMFAGVASRLSGERDSYLHRMVPFALLGGALAMFALLRAVLLAVAASTSTNCLVLDVITLAGAALLAGIRYQEIAPFARPLLRGIGGVVLVQVAFDVAALIADPAAMTSGANGAFFAAGGALALIAGIGGLWRPSFLLPLFFHYVAFRHQLSIVGGIEISETDYLSMLDVGEFVALGTLLVACITRPAFLDRFGPGRLNADEVRAGACALLVAWAIGAHLGNYFVSGWTKIRAGGADPFFWLLHNPTQTAILVGLERGDNMLAAWPRLVQLSWDAITNLLIPVNLFVLGTQFLVPLAALHRRALMVATVLFDLFHVVVYFTLGAAFFFWVAVNILIYLSLKRIDDRARTPELSLVTIVAILTAHWTFYTSHLGWLDSAKLASPLFFAETRDGREVAVPSVYFGNASYSIAQTAMYVPDENFAMRIGGNTHDPADWRRAQRCTPDFVRHQDTGVTLPAVENMVRATDAAMRRHPIVKNDNLYYFYPYHMVANPMMFAAFNRLRIGDIVRYHYVVESVCLGLRHGKLVRNVLKRTDFPIDVSR